MMKNQPSKMQKFGTFWPNFSLFCKIKSYFHSHEARLCLASFWIAIIAGFIVIVAVVACLVVAQTGDVKPATNPEASATTASEEIKTQVKAWEGLTLVATADANGYSIGYGHYGVSAEETIDLATAEEYFALDCEKVEQSVNSFCVEYNLVLTQGQFDALFSFLYNLGVNYLEKVEDNNWPLWDYLTTGNYTPAEMVEEWTSYCHGTVDGERQELPGLLARRQYEVQLWLGQ